MNPKPPKPPLHHRLVFRFAVIMALTMLAFDQLAETIHETVFKAFGVPTTFVIADPISPESGEPGDDGLRSPFEGMPALVGGTFFQDPLALESALAAAETAEDFTQLIPMLSGLVGPCADGERIGATLLVGAERLEAGMHSPDPTAVDTLRSDLAPQGLGFVWTSAGRLPLESSDPERFLGLEWIRTGDLPTHSHWFPIEDLSADELAGWLVLYGEEPEGGMSGAGGLGMPPAGFEGLENAQILAPAEAMRLQRRMHNLARVTSWCTTLLIALLLGVTLSRLVTRRLGHLTAAVADFGIGVNDESVVPALSPLPPRLISGRDEIAQLASAFASSRERIAELLETLALRDRTRREWVAHASHDLRTPLTALSACLDRAEELVSAGSSAEGADLNRVLSSARSDCERLHELTGDLLALARLEASDEFTPEPLLAAELAERAQGDLRPLAESQGVTLDLDLGEPGGGPLSFDGDGQGILRVLENLLRNAIQHAHERVVLRVQRIACEAPSPGSAGEMPRHDGSMELARPTDGHDRILFEVLDDGAGFDAGTPKAPTSCGIGLRVARRFVELHGGRLETGDWTRGGRAAFSLPI